MDRSELISYLVEEEVITEHQAHEMDNYSLFVEAIEYNGIIGYDQDIKDWIEPYYQEHFSQSPEELNISACWIQKKYHELVDKGIIKENESEPAVEYPNNIFLP
jgi:hypothetical protein